MAQKKTTIQKKTTSRKVSMPKDPSFITEYDRYLFGTGTDYKIYQKMGAHKAKLNGKTGMHFAVWAPNAKAVSIVCERNNWDPKANYMLPLEKSGIFEGFMEGMDYGEIYKYTIETQTGDILYKADPYAFSAELRPGNASKTADISSYKWKDAKWMESRKEHTGYDQPMSIYEVHLGSWRKKDDGSEDGFMNYREYADELVEYCAYMGYTHVELMGIAEHPFDGSWGYQVTGYYAPTSRYGAPQDFMYLVDTLHKHHIGVILDWVPAHFPKDAFGLADFDGTPTYEYADPRMGEHPDWGTKIFNYSKNEVKNFLIGNALYWFDEYHIDGIRLTDTATMLYLDYGKRPGEWTPNMYGGNENLDAIEFIKQMNAYIHSKNRNIISIADETSRWPGVTDTNNETLGFDYKLNDGLAEEFREFIKQDPLFRKGVYNKLTYEMFYHYKERFMTSVSYDALDGSSIYELVAGNNKNSRLADIRAALGYIYTYPGAKCISLGNDTGILMTGEESVKEARNRFQENEYKDMLIYISQLNRMYRSEKALYELDDKEEGFNWIDNYNAAETVLAYERISKDNEKLLIAVNFTPVQPHDGKPLSQIPYLQE